MKNLKLTGFAVLGIALAIIGCENHWMKKLTDPMYVKTVTFNLGAPSTTALSDTPSTFTMENKGGGDKQYITLPDNNHGNVSQWASGRNLAGWSDGNGTTYTPGEPYKVTQDITLYAEWDGQTGGTETWTEYTVAFDTNGGIWEVNPLPDMDVKAGETIELPHRHELYHPDSFFFAGWNTAADGSGTNHNVGSAYTPTRSITLFAVWVDLDSQALITFDLNGGIGNAPPFIVIVAIDLGGTIALPGEGGFSNPGHELVGWTLDSTDTDSSNTTVTNYTVLEPGPFTFYAVWVSTDTYYTVTFNLNGGTGNAPPTQQVTTGETINLPSGTAVSWPGYTLNGWYTKKVGGTATTIFGAAASLCVEGVEKGTITVTSTGNTYNIDMEDNTITFYAVWEVADSIQTSDIAAVKSYLEAAIDGGIDEVTLVLEGITATPEKMDELMDGIKDALGGVDSTNRIDITLDLSGCTPPNEPFRFHTGNGIPDNARQCMVNVILPEDITTIAVSAFENFKSLTEITLPASLVTIGQSAFQGCKGLTDIDLPYGVTSIGENAFLYCSNLTNVTIPDSVTSIGIRAFNQTNIKSITLPSNSSFTTILDDTFYGCESLTSITIPASVTSIGFAAFLNCTSLERVTFDMKDTSFTANAGLWDSFPNAASLLAAYADGGIGTYTRASTPGADIPDNVPWVKQTGP